VLFGVMMPRGASRESSRVCELLMCHTERMVT
jgi:hypothetical protein